MQGNWFFLYVAFVKGLNGVEMKVQLSARKERKAVEEAKALWETMPKSVEYISRSSDADLPVVFPHSPQLLCVLDCVIDPLDKGGRSELESPLE